MITVSLIASLFALAAVLVLVSGWRRLRRVPESGAWRGVESHAEGASIE